MGVEPSLEDERSGLLIYHKLAFGPRNVGVDQSTLYCNCRKSLIPFVDGDRVVEFFPQRGGKYAHALGPGARVAGQLQGQPNHDFGDVSVVDHGAHAIYVTGCALARNGLDRMTTHP